MSDIINEEQNIKAITKSVLKSNNKNNQKNKI